MAGDANVPRVWSEILHISRSVGELHGKLDAHLRTQQEHAAAIQNLNSRVSTLEARHGIKPKRHWFRISLFGSGFTGLVYAIFKFLTLFKIL